MDCKFKKAITMRFKIDNWEGVIVNWCENKNEKIIGVKFDVKRRLDLFIKIHNYTC